MAKESKKPQTVAELKNVAIRAPVKKAPVAKTPSVAKRLKREWREAKKNGEKRSLRAYAEKTDLGPRWLANKKAS